MSFLTNKKSSTRRFFVRQMMLLVITAVLVAFCAVPLVKAVKVALNPTELEQELNSATQEVAGLETKVDDGSVQDNHGSR